MSVLDPAGGLRTPTHAGTFADVLANSILMPFVHCRPVLMAKCFQTAKVG